jgi:hypothetical protein
VGQEEFCFWIWFWRASVGYNSKFFGHVGVQPSLLGEVSLPAVKNASSLAA